MHYHWEHYQRALKFLDKQDWREALWEIDKARAACDKEVPWQFHLVNAWASIKDLADEDEWPERDSILADLQKADEAAKGVSPDVSALLAYARYKRNQLREALPCLLRCLGRSSIIPRCSVIAHADLVALLCDTLAGILEELENADAFESSRQYCVELSTMINAVPLASLSLKRTLSAEVLATKAFCEHRLGEESDLVTTLSTLRLLDHDHPRLQSLAPASGSANADAGGGEERFDFSQVAGSDVKGTFTNQLRRIYRLHFPKKTGGQNALSSRFAARASSYLIYGPSGSGKTYAINAFAGQYMKDHEQELPVIRMRINELMSKWLGESEKAITSIVDEAISRAPAILFADELDALGQGRSSSGQDWRNTQVAHFLQELDRLRKSRRKVIFFGSTNHLQMIDLAIIRRFDQVIPADMPDEATRKRIFEVQFEQHSPDIRPSVLDWGEVIKLSHGLTPGDIERAVRKAFDEHQGLMLDQDDPKMEPLPYSLLADAVRQQDAHHVREWLSQTARTLRQQGYPDRAEALEKRYSDFVKNTGVAKAPSDSGAMVAALPVEAWDEVPAYR